MQNLDFGKLFNEGVLIDLTVSKWTGKAKLEAQDLGLHSEDVPEFYSLGRKPLVKKESIDKFCALHSRAYNYLNKYGFKFPIGNHFFIPHKNILELLNELNKLKVEYDNEVAEFITHYSEARNEMIIEYEKFEKAKGINITKGIRNKYLSTFQLKRKFCFDWTFFAITGADGALANVDSRAIKDQAEENIKLTQEYREKAKKMINEFLENVVVELRDKTLNLCEIIQQKLNDKEVITETNLKSLRNFVDYFEGLNFVGDKTIDQQLIELRKHLNGRSAKEYKDSRKVKSELRTILNDIITKASETSDISKVTGQFKRKIEF